MTARDPHAAAAALDAGDTLAPLRGRFAIPSHIDGNPAIYLCGHSLGLAPLAARELLTEELDDWQQLAVLGHHVGRRPWIGYAALLQPALARIVGAEPAEVVAMNSLTVNLHLMMASFYRPEGQRRCVVVEQGIFASDRHAVESQLQLHGVEPAALLEVEADEAGLIDHAGLERLLAERGAEVALVLWPGVQYRTGQAFDVARIVRAAHAAGAACGFDLAHAAGNLPLRLHADGADFAVWCNYKYLNGGPGAIGAAFIHARHQRATVPGLAGWWGHEPASRFRMEPAFEPAAGAAGWQVSNPPVFSAAPLLASLRLFDDAGMPALRAKSMQMTAFLQQQFEARFASRLECITPRDPSQRGCQLSLRLRAGPAAGRRVFEDLGASGVVADWREPDILRVAPVPLYNRFAELAVFCDLLEVALRQNT